MDAAEFRGALDQLGLTQSECARLLGVEPRSARRWASGETEVPGPVMISLRGWLAHPALVIDAKRYRLAEVRDADQPMPAANVTKLRDVK